MRGNTLGRGRRHRELYLFREARINEYCWNVKYNAGCRGEQVHDLEASKGLCPVWSGDILEPLDLGMCICTRAEGRWVR